MEKRRSVRFLALLITVQLFTQVALAADLPAENCPSFFARIAARLGFASSVTANAEKPNFSLAKYFAGKIVELKYVDKNSFKQLELRANLMLAKPFRQVRMVKLREMGLLHDMEGWAEAEAKFRSRVAALQPHRERVKAEGQLTVAEIHKLLPSKEKIRVAEMEPGRYVVIDGNSRLAAIKTAFDPDIEVEVEVFRGLSGRAKGLIDGVRRMADNPHKLLSEDEMIRTFGLSLDPAKPLVYKYAPTVPEKLQKPAREFWKKKLGLDLNDGALISGHLSKPEVVKDSLLAFSRRGDDVQVLGRLDGMGNEADLFGRRVSQGLQLAPGTKPALVIVDEASLLAAGRDLEQVLAPLRKGDTPVMVLRNGKGTSTPSVLKSDTPHVMEALSFEGSKGTPSLALATGNREMIDPLVRASERRAQWLGKSVQERGTAHLRLGDETPPALTAFEADHPLSAGLKSHIPEEEVQEETFGDLMKIFESHPPTSRDQEFSLGQGQPAVEFDPRLYEQGVYQSRNLSAAEGKAKAQKAVASWYKKQYGTEVNPANVSFGQGVSGSIIDLFRTLPKNSTIMVPDFSYNYEVLAQLLGHKVERLKITPETLKQIQARPDRGLLLVNFPHNPTGKMMTEEMRKSLQEAAANGLTVVNDLSSPRFRFDGQPVGSLLQGHPNQKNLLEIISSSKDMGMPEQRISAVVGDPEIQRRMQALPLADQNDITGDRYGIFGHALEHPEMYRTSPLEMKKRRDMIAGAFREAGWPEAMIPLPEGGLNIMINLPEGVDPVLFTAALWRKTHVTVLPDLYFGKLPEGMPRFVRVSLSEPSEKLEKLTGLFREKGLRFDQLNEWLANE